MNQIVCMLAAVTVGYASQPPAKPPEAWVRATTEKGVWKVRVDGGKTEQVAAPRPDLFGVPTWVRPEGFDGGFQAYPIGDGKRVVFLTEDRTMQGKPKRGDFYNKLVAVDPDGKNPRQLVTGVKWNQAYSPTPDGKAVVCGAFDGAKWHLFRVPLGGTPATKISRIAGIDSPSFRVLPDGRVVYMPITGWHVEKVQFGTLSNGKGPVILTDGKTEAVLVEESVAGIPEVTDDATKVAVHATTAAGERVVRITDRTTGKAEEFPLKAFHKDWTCEFGLLKFRPDGKALTVGFGLGGVVFRKSGPLPGDEAVQHFGVIWLDGRKDRTQVFKIDQPLLEHGYFPEIRHLDWTDGPPKK